MGDIIRFRPTPEERRLLDHVRRKYDLGSATEAVRFLIRERTRAEKANEEANERLFAFRVPPEFQLKGRSLTSEEIDEVVYGDHVWRDER